MFQNALTRLIYTKNEENKTEWGSEIDSLIQWLKNYNLLEINNLSSFLNLSFNFIYIYNTYLFNEYTSVFSSCLRVKIPCQQSSTVNNEHLTCRVAGIFRR